MFKLQFKDNPSRSLWLVGEKVTLGSGAGNTVVLDGLGVDELHAELLIEPNYLILKARSGSCIVNDLPVDDGFQLKAGDELRIGRDRLMIVDPRQQPAAPDKATSMTSKRMSKADWELIPDHPKLKALDFSIRGRVVLGRARECELSVPYKLLSREHAQLWIDSDQLFVKDLGSANGCYVNGKRVQEARLVNGDKIAFAKLMFSVQGAGSESSPEQADTAEMNRTMIRPAINLDAELAAQEASRESNSIQLELGAMAGATDNGGHAGQSGVKTRVVAIFAALVMAGAAAWFFLVPV